MLLDLISSAPQYRMLLAAMAKASRRFWRESVVSKPMGFCAPVRMIGLGECITR